MDGLRFAKLCRDCDLMDARLTSTTVDLIFTKVKAKVRADTTGWGDRRGGLRRARQPAAHWRRLPGGRRSCTLRPLPTPKP
jgi:hypothetical protein